MTDQAHIFINTRGGQKDYLPQDEVDALTPALLRERMIALKPLVESHAAEAERLRRPTDEVWAALRQSGLFYLFVPKMWGGMEGSLEDYVDVILPLAEADASIAWVASFCMEKNLILGRFPRQAQEEIFPNFPYIVGPGVATPGGELTPVEGGYRLTGRYSWATGVMHGDWVAAAAMDRSGAEPRAFTCLLPIEEVRVVDTWHVDGMAATGSNDIWIDDVFVPTHRTAPSYMTRPDLEVADVIHESPLYHVPKLPLLTLACTIAGVGAARGMVARFAERMQKRTMWGTQTKQVEKPSAMIRLGLAESKAETAELMLRDAARALMEAGRNWAAPDNREIARIRSQLAHAIAVALSAVRTIADAAGTSVHYNSNPMQRIIRDLTVLSTHFVFDMDATMEERGRRIIADAPVDDIERAA